MEFSVGVEGLQKALKKTAGVVAKNSPQEALKNVLLEAAADGQLTVSAQGTTLALITTLPADIKTPGRLSVEHQVLKDLVDNYAKDGKVSIKSRDGFGVAIASGKAKTSLEGLDPALAIEVRRPAPGATFSVPRAVFCDKVAKVAISTNPDDEQMASLGGVCMYAEAGGLRLATTDKHRLTYATCPASLSEGSLPRPKVLVPIKGLKQVKDIFAACEELAFGFDDNRAYLASDDTVLFMRLIDAEPLNFAAVTPKLDGLKPIQVRRDELQSAIRRVTALFNKDSDPRAVILIFSADGLGLKYRTLKGESTEDLEATSAAETMEVHLSFKYMLDAMSVIDAEELEIWVTNARAPICLTAAGTPDFMAIVMPMDPTRTGI